MSGSGCQGGMQPKQTLLGQGPKFGPPQLLHGGVGGGVHVGWGRCCTAAVSDACEGGDGEDGSDVVAHSGVI